MLINEHNCRSMLLAALQEYLDTHAGVRNKPAFDLLSIGDLATDLAPLLLKQIKTEVAIAPHQ